MATADNHSVLLSTIDFDFETISTAAAAFGLEAAHAVRLQGYEDANYLVTAAEGGKVVLKLTATPNGESLIVAEAALLAHLASRVPTLPIPRMPMSEAGSPYARLETSAGTVCARVHSFLQGRQLMQFRPRTRSLRTDLGRQLGQLDKALADFDHEAFHRYIEWDIVHVPAVRDDVNTLSDAAVRKRVNAALDLFDEEVVPELPHLRRSIIHADANDHNILASATIDGDPYVSGIVDFGDAVHTITAGEVAVACTYVMLGERDPLGAAADLIAGYHEAFPLKPEELELLYPLVLGRLAMSACFSARWRTNHGHSEYHSISESDVIALLEALGDVSPVLAHFAFRDACGLPGSPASERVVTYLKSDVARVGPVLRDVALTDAVVFDLSVASPDAADPDDTSDAATWTRTLFDKIVAAGGSVGVGPYDEPRLCYDAEQFLTRSGERRTIHLGIDLFASAGTSVLAPLDATVHSVRDNDLRLDYGPTVILRHDVTYESDAERMPPFFTLYGHLSRASVQAIRPGQAVARGDQIGEIGSIGENGGWPPHLHFQLITDMLGMKGNFPGVAPAPGRRLWTSICPDPNAILQIPDAKFLKTLPQSDLSARRSDYLGRNLSLSYAEPLHIVRGRGQYLFDAQGRAFLDCVNNVAHVGHCHPRVVEAAYRQMRVLNTNTRYLHDNIVTYAERLAATMPDPLHVCYFVNSGSEANDLALRLARAHTGATDVLVVDSAYHGNLSSLIDISPYKAEGGGGGGLPAHVHRLRIPDTRGQNARGADGSTAIYREEGASALDALTGENRRLSAFIAESALGCAGQVMLPAHYLQAVYGVVRSHGGVCIADEVQVGFGRLGTHFWGFQVQGVIPDIVTLGKPIGNGHPLGAVVTTAEIAASFDNGMEYFNTFGGNPVSTAVGLEVLDVLRDEGLQHNALTVGNKLMSDLLQLQKRHTIIGDVRGSGLFVGIEFTVRGKPATREARYVVNRLKDLGVLFSTDGPDRNVLKLKPPMVFSHKDTEKVITELDHVLGDDYLRSAV